ncbi:MAG: hypothetical protein WCQ49_01400 [Candidatus Saccharibacteria bacterium]
MDEVREIPSNGARPIEALDIKESQNQSITIDSILDTELTVESIDNYAENAFRKLLIFAIGKIEEFEKSQSTEGLNTSKEIEDAAFKYFGIEDISSVLDRIIAENDRIYNLDKVIAKSKRINSVIVPTSSEHGLQAGSGGEYNKPALLNRLKAILYILEKKYEVDTNDEDQISVIEGENTDDMMRQSSYFMIEARKLKRTILVCNETNNASYVFNSDILTEKGIKTDELFSLSKQDLNSMLQATPEIGKRVVYSKVGFIPRIIDSIENPISSQPDEVKPELSDSGRLLKEKMPEGYRSNHRIASENGVADSTIINIISKIRSRTDYNNELEAKSYLYGNIVTKGYSQEQVDLIVSQLDHSPEMPEGYKSIRKIALDMGVSPNTVKNAIDKMTQEKDYDGYLDAEEYRYFNVVTKCYSPEQQQSIIDFLNIAPPPPEGYKAISSIAEETGAALDTIRSTIKRIRSADDYNGQLEANIYRFKPHSVEGYAPEQQAYIIENIKIAPPAPEGYKTTFKIALDNNLTTDTVNDAIDQIRASEQGREKLATKEYKFNTSVNEGFSLEQQEIILSQINIAPPPPEGYITLSGLAKNLGIAYDKLKNAVETIKNSESYSGELDAGLYKFFNNTVEAYSPEQQEYMKNYLEIAPPAPEGYKSIGVFAKNLGIDHRNLKTTIEIIKSNDDYNGGLDIKLYRFGRTTAFGLSPEQQELILKNISRRKTRRS